MEMTIPVMFEVHLNSSLQEQSGFHCHLQLYSHVTLEAPKFQHVFNFRHAALPKTDAETNKFRCFLSELNNLCPQQP